MPHVRNLNVLFGIPPCRGKYGVEQEDAGDKLMSGDGLDGVDALIAGVQQKFPDFKFSLIGQPNGFGDHLRFSWGLGPDGVDSPIKGTDFALLKEGRIRSITGFLDQVPQGA